MTGIVYARDVLFMSEEEIWSKVNDRRPHVLRFDDGEIDSTWGQNMFSWYYWNILRRWPDTTFSMKLHLGGQAVSKGMENKLQRRIKEALRECHPDIPINTIFTMYAEATNALHNAVVLYGMPHEATVDALDLLDIVDHPGIQEALGKFDGTKKGIATLYRTCEKILQTAPELTHSCLVRMHRNKQPKAAQVHQLMFSRGFCSETSQLIFAEAVRPGYVHGYRRIADTLMDSRTGSIAQIATTVPVEQSELYNRELQLITYVLHTVDPHDCGTDEGIPWHVQRSDLDSVLVGIYYKTTNGWRPIQKSDSHLCDKTITIRNPATCMHPDDGTVCRYCIGDAVAEIDPNANPGFLLTIEQNRKTTQDTISTKHLLASAIGEAYVIDPFYRNYLDNEVDSHELMLATALASKHVILRFHVRDFTSVTDISSNPERSLRNPSHATEIHEMEMEIDHADGRQPERIMVPTSKGSFRPYLSRDFLQYMIDNGHDVDNGYVVVDMMQWDPDVPIMIFPQRRGSTLELLKDMKSAIFMTDATSRLKAKRDINDPEVLSDCLREVSEISNRKFDVNLSITAVIMYCMMIRSARQNDFRLPKPWTPRQFSPQSKVMNGRSLGAKFAHSRQFEVIPDPRSYVHRTRSNHTFDSLIVNIDECNRRNQMDADLAAEREMERITKG